MMTALRTAPGLLFAMLALSLAQPTAAKAEDRALLVGIGTYESLPEDMFLHGPKNDVKAIEALLTGTLSFKPESIRILTDDKARRTTILSTIDDWLISGTEPGDRIYLYFSGHGLQVKDVSKDEEDGMDEALSTYDIKAGETDWTNVILDDDLEALLERMKGRAVTLVVDACHSGTISRSLSAEQLSGMKGARYLPRPFATALKNKVTRGLRIDLGVVDKPAKLTEGGVTAWSAAAPYQVAWDDVRLPIEDRHGVFTSAYVAGYKPSESDGNSNGLVSNAELFQYVTEKSKDYCSAQENCDNLDPQLESVPDALGTSVAKPEPYEQPATAADKTEPVYQEAKAESGTTPAYVDANPVAAIGDIVGKADTGDVMVSLDTGPALRKGQPFKISVTSKYDGHLVLLDVNREGVATQIFPNTLAQKITPLSAGSTLTIPDDYYGFDFEAEGSGESMLVAIVVSDDLDLKDVAPPAQGLNAELDARKSLSEIVSRLQKTWTGDAENRGVRWSLGTLKYTVD
ncbi:caspase family protein [Pararhizobium sp. BT-229]|uniref:caspase family protein n=1 Tax=Pararhizobium sp. BT-229 TaxID=2986923 RepID=UPI0021F6A009|nr:caspase family protein [Pararhizobium sp. BT-229]MCV9965325.1 caspase family protein [Pararhizobium sp. BT-229]